VILVFRKAGTRELYRREAPAVWGGTIQPSLLQLLLIYAAFPVFAARFLDGSSRIFVGHGDLEYAVAHHRLGFVKLGPAPHRQDPIEMP
jgi:hypothetical protein